MTIVPMANGINQPHMVPLFETFAPNLEKPLRSLKSLEDTYKNANYGKQEDLLVRMNRKLRLRSHSFQ